MEWGKARDHRRLNVADGVVEQRRPCKHKVFWLVKAALRRDRERKQAGKCHFKLSKNTSERHQKKELVTVRCMFMECVEGNENGGTWSTFL